MSLTIRNDLPIDFKRVLTLGQHAFFFGLSSGRGLRRMGDNHAAIHAAKSE